MTSDWNIDKQNCTKAFQAFIANWACIIWTHGSQYPMHICVWSHAIKKNY